MAAAVTVCGPDRFSWFAPTTWPKCRCGFDPHNNKVLDEHWRQQGFRVHADGDLLVVRQIPQTPEEVAAWLMQ